MNPTPADVALADQWVRQGYQQHQAGQWQAARQAYEQALQRAPQHPAALHLLGVVLRHLGQPAPAEQLLRRSVQVNPAQPAAWHQLGGLLEEQGQTSEALQCYERAVAAEPRYGEAHYHRALLLHTMGRLHEAMEAVQKVLGLLASPHANVLQLKALIEADLGQLDAALITVEQALRLEPDKPALHHNRGTTLQRLSRHRDALAAHEQALSLGLDVADAHYNHGNTLQSLGQLDAAAAAYRRALERQPGHPLALYDLARLRWRQGDPDFDAELRLSGAQQPQSAVAPGLRANLLMKGERFEEAAAAFRQALAIEPDAAGFHSGLARCLASLGQIDEALQLHARAAQLSPADATVHACHAAALLQARRPEPAAEAVALARQLAPHDQFVLAVQGLVWRMLGDPREAWLNDVDRFIGVVDLPAPSGFADMASFNRALIEELDALHRDAAPPVDQTLRRGTQTLGDIFEQGHPLVNLLKERISQAIDAHIAQLPVDPSHPFLGRRALAWRFTDSWSSRLGQGGFHTNHVHPHGWLSSAYYVQVPPAAADAARREGWLQFGQPDFDVGVAGAVRRQVQPKPGRLALFPSMMWHGTTPFTDDAPRMTIAFDVMPTGAGR